MAEARAEIVMWLRTYEGLALPGKWGSGALPPLSTTHHHSPPIQPWARPGSEATLQKCALPSSEDFVLSCSTPIPETGTLNLCTNVHIVQPSSSGSARRATPRERKEYGRTP